MPKTKELKSPPTSEMQEYIDIDLRLKELEARKEELRPVVLSQFKDSGEKFEGISCSERKTYPIDEEKFYNWVKETWPDKVDKLKKDLIDPAKFERAYALGEIDYEQLPGEIYTEKSYNVINIRKR